MKNTLLALALFAFAGTAVAQDGAKKATASTSPKSACAMSAKSSVAGGAACCSKGAKTASVKPAVKAPTVVKL